MSSRVRFSDEGMNRDSMSSYHRGLDSGLTISPLPSHAHQIMDAFLWNKKNSKHEQREHQQVQSLILSRLRRAAVRSREEVQPLVPRQHHSSSSKNYENAPNNTQQNVVDKADQRTVKNQRSHRTHHDESRPPNNHLGSLNNYEKASNNTRRDVVDQRTMVNHRNHDDQHPPINQLSSLDKMSLNNNENASMNAHRNVVNQQTKMNYRSHHRHSEAGPRKNEPLNIRDGDEEEDIVCCDRGHCHEGAKNLCTISLWAFLFFLLVNRFFVHMAMHLHKNESVTPKHHADAVPTSIGVDQLEMQHIEPMANFTVIGLGANEK